VWFDVVPRMDNIKERDFKVCGGKNPTMGLGVDVVKKANCIEQYRRTCLYEIAADINFIIHWGKDSIVHSTIKSKTWITVKTII